MEKERKVHEYVKESDLLKEERRELFKEVGDLLLEGYYKLVK